MNESGTFFKIPVHAYFGNVHDLILGQNIGKDVEKPYERSYGQHFLWDMNKTKWCNGVYIEFIQNFAKETFSYDEHLKSYNIQY